MSANTTTELPKETKSPDESVDAAMACWPEFPEIMGERITREEIIEGFRESYSELCRVKRMIDPSFRRYPDFETILDWIDEHGLPPANVEADRSEP